MVIRQLAYWSAADQGKSASYRPTSLPLSHAAVSACESGITALGVRTLHVLRSSAGHFKGSFRTARPAYVSFRRLLCAAYHSGSEITKNQSPCKHNINVSTALTWFENFANPFRTAHILRRTATYIKNHAIISKWYYENLTTQSSGARAVTLAIVNSVLSDFSNMNVIRELLHIKHNFVNMTLRRGDWFILEYCCTS